MYWTVVVSSTIYGNSGPIQETGGGAGRRLTREAYGLSYDHRRNKE
jgi:hypothetical protein